MGRRVRAMADNFCLDIECEGRLSTDQKRRKCPFGMADPARRIPCKVFLNLRIRLQAM